VSPVLAAAGQHLDNRNHLIEVVILSLYFTIAVLGIINFPPLPARVAGS
jgi:hypothetical protein